ncbi:MAG: AraC family transcriptional regulator [Polyangiales bacterium]
MPLWRYPILDATSLDEAAAVYSQVAPLRLHQMANTGAFCWRINSVELGPLSISAMDNSASIRAKFEGASDALLLCVTLGESAAESSSGRSATPVARGKAGALTLPWQDVGVVSPAGFQALQVRMPHDAVLNAMATLTGSEVREPSFQRRFALDSPLTEPFMRMLLQLLREADQERTQLLAPGERECAAEALLFRFLLSQPQAHASLHAPAQVAEPRYVRRAAEYLDTHGERQVTMAELTRVVGVSARSLQLGFVKHRGHSPLAFVRARRLERARVLLLTSDAADTVSEAARLAGIEHLGRFSVRYRARFGESPRHTLARRWRPISR